MPRENLTDFINENHALIAVLGVFTAITFSAAYMHDNLIKTLGLFFYRLFLILAVSAIIVVVFELVANCLVSIGKKSTLRLNLFKGLLILIGFSIVLYALVVTYHSWNNRYTVWAVSCLLGCLIVFQLPRITSIRNLFLRYQVGRLPASFKSIGVLVVVASITFIASPNIKDYLDNNIERIYYKAIDEYINILRYDSHQVNRLEAAQALGESSDARAVEPLIDALGDKENQSNVIVAIERALGQLQANESVSFLCEIMRDTGNASTVRSSAAEALGDIKDGKAVADLLFIVDNDSSPDVVSSAVLALAKINDSTATEHLIAVFDRDVPDEVIMDAGGAIVEIKDPEKVDMLIEEMQTEETPVNARATAAYTLGEIGDTKATEDLIDILGDNSAPSNVRINAAEALGKIGGARAVDQLCESLDDERKIQVAAVKALIVIGDDHSVSDLTRTLEKHGTKEIAGYYLTCGNDDLETRAGEWVARQDYSIESARNSVAITIQWGGKEHSD